MAAAPSGSRRASCGFPASAVVIRQPLGGSSAAQCCRRWPSHLLLDQSVNHLLLLRQQSVIVWQRIHQVPICAPIVQVCHWNPVQLSGGTGNIIRSGKGGGRPGSCHLATATPWCTFATRCSFAGDIADTTRITGKDGTEGMGDEALVAGRLGPPPRQLAAPPSSSPGPVAAQPARSHPLSLGCTAPPLSHSSERFLQSSAHGVQRQQLV